MTLNPQNRGFNVFLQFSAAVHILRVYCADVAGDKLEKPKYEIFSIKRT